jgi:hypothetical protein
MRKQLTGKPIAGKLHTGFGGREGESRSLLIFNIIYAELRLQKPNSAEYCKTAWKNDQLIGENRVIADHVKITNALFFNIFIARKLVKIMREVANY